MKTIISWALLSMFLSACSTRVFMPWGRGVPTAAQLEGMCMPTLTLDVHVSTTLTQTAAITLVNPHETEECELSEHTGGIRLSSCSYRVRSLAEPYVLLIRMMPASDTAASTCAVEPERIFVHRLDHYLSYDIQRVRAPPETGGICVYVVRRRGPT